MAYIDFPLTDIRRRAQQQNKFIKETDFTVHKHIYVLSKVQPILFYNKIKGTNNQPSE